MRIGAAVLGFVSACSFPHGSLSTTDAPEGSGSGSGSGSAMIDASIDARPDAPPDAPPSIQVTATFPVTQDTYVDSLNPSSGFGSAQNMLADGSTQAATALFRADLSAIPATAVVQSCVLHIWVSNDTGGDVSVYQMLVSWDEANASWTDRSAGTQWTVAGAAPPSRGTTVLATLTPDAMYAEKTGTIANSVVQQWVTTPATNYGLAIATASSDGSTWRTRENPTVTSHPYFAITYVTQ